MKCTAMSELRLGCLGKQRKERRDAHVKVIHFPAQKVIAALITDCACAIERANTLERAISRKSTIAVLISAVQPLVLRHFLERPSQALADRTRARFRGVEVEQHRD